MEAVLPILLSRADPDRNCTIDTCPVQDSVYGYYPSKPVNLLFAVLFAIAGIAQLWQGIKWKSWTFLIALAVGSVGETIGMLSF